MRNIHFRVINKQVIGLCVALLCILLGLIVYEYYIHINFPPEPIPSGDFPSESEWVFSANNRITATPITYGSEVIIRTINTVYALESVNGKIIWQAESIGTSPLSVAPQLEDDIIVVPEKGAKLAAFSIYTGHLIWRTPEIEINLKNPGVAAIESLLILDKVVYVARSDLGITSYSIEDGHILWEVEVRGRANPYIAVDNRLIYLSSGQLLRAYSIDEGELIWEKKFNTLLGPILVYRNCLYVSLLTGVDVLVTINLETLEEVWRLRSNDIESYGIRYMVIQDGVLYIATNRLSAISISNAQVYWISDKTELLEPPIIDGENIFVRNTGVTLFYLDATNGQVKGQLLVQMDTAMRHQPPRSPVMADGLLIVPFGDNRVFAYRP